MKRASLLLVVLLATPACDELSSALQVSAPDDVAFRGDPSPPEALYITKWSEAPIRRDDVLELVMSCKQHKDPVQTCTLSWYQPDSTKPERVLGLGCSMMADFDLWKCYHEVMLKNGAQPL